MAKTTVLVQLLAGPGVPVTPGYIRFTVPFRRVDGNAVLTTAPAPESLDSQGRATIAVDPGVWIVDEILPGYLKTRAVLVPESSTPVQYATLTEVDNPDRIDGFGPTWASRAEAASAEAQRQALLAEVSAGEAAATIATFLADGVVRTINGQRPDAAGNINVSGGTGGGTGTPSTFGESWLELVDADAARVILGVQTPEELAEGDLGTRSGSKPIGEGEDYVSIADYCTPGWNRVTESGVDNGIGDVADGGNPMQRAFDAAASSGLPLFIGPGDWYSSKGVKLLDTGITFHPASTGAIVQPRYNPALEVRHTIRNPRVLSAYRHIWVRSVDTGSPEQVYAQLEMSATNTHLENPQRGDSFVLAGGVKIPGAFLGENGGRRAMTQEWIKVLGVGLDVVDVSSTLKLSQGQRIVGQTSGASAWVMSSVLTRPAGGAIGQKGILLNNITRGSGSTGHFAAGESLLVDGTIVGSVVPDRGPYIITDRPLEYTHDASARLQKGLATARVDLSGLRTKSSGDPHQFFTKAEIDNGLRQPAVRLALVSNFGGYFQCDSGWKAALEIQGCFDGEIEYSADGLPDLAEDTQAGWGYGCTVVGAAMRIKVHSRFSRGGRHGFTTNVVPTLGPAGDQDYWATQGVPIGIEVSGYFTGFTDAGIDFHGGARKCVVTRFHVKGSGAYGRTQSRSAGVQVRGVDVIVKDGLIEDTVDGVRDSSYVWPSAVPGKTKNTYSNIHMRNIRRLGFDFLAGDSAATIGGDGGPSLKHKHKVTDCHVDLDPSYSNPNERWGIDQDFGILEVDGLTVTGHDNGGYIRIGALQKFVHRRGYSDHSDSTTAGQNITATSTTPIPRVVIKGLEIEPSGETNGGYGAAVFRTPANQTVYTANVDANIDQTAVFALATGGSNKITVRASKQTGRELNLQSAADFTPGTIAAGTSVLSPAYTPAGVTVDPADWADARWLGAALPAGVMQVPRVNSNNTLQLELFNATPAPVTIVGPSAVRYRVRK